MIASEYVDERNMLANSVGGRVASTVDEAILSVTTQSMR
jgi:hypothetical protein